MDNTKSRHDVIFEDEGSICGLRDPIILIPRVILGREQFVRLKSDEVDFPAFFLSLHGWQKKIFSFTTPPPLT